MQYRKDLAAIRPDPGSEQAKYHTPCNGSDIFAFSSMLPAGKYFKVTVKTAGQRCCSGNHFTHALPPIYASGLLVWYVRTPYAGKNPSGSTAEDLWIYQRSW
jgi:hypothetical protein